MNTYTWNVDKNVDIQKSYPQIRQAAELLQRNEVVAFPTETVYGLGANATSSEAVRKIYEAKGRPSDNPLIVHIDDKRQLGDLVAEIPASAYLLMDEFWPGPLTIIFAKKPGVFSDIVTAGLDTVAIRVPDHPVARAILHETNLPIAAPSANRSGRPSPTTAHHVATDLTGRIAGIVDGGPTGVGVESTVIDCTVTPPMILRPGGVTAEQIREVIGDVSIDPSLKEGEGAPKSPGMKYTHYAPEAPVYLVEGNVQRLQQLIDRKQAEGMKVGVMSTREAASDLKADVVVTCGSREDLSTVARDLYEALRHFNETDVDIILSETFSKEGIGSAIMNRLEKAAGYNYL
ncbi:tRNA threonylcarbamoyladenosine biosynthesis protein [Bacillus coahuilensis p1.1.43]|uniref:Threonylcarbamoyl-AMP synthase n=1 Tax=Bacillus coahuilensis p1.1.43 TaxID=1150625 RepID=A0A147K4A9_9BACI|nr:L-threonylcarbamoyladenylate synthase [Bacillus coahuilensis]KUP04173.1 tRNA threonylcarbamoyladenosine biosynthesis protein [Bacillus coahuilensis p1.1.43]